MRFRPFWDQFSSFRQSVENAGLVKGGSVLRGEFVVGTSAEPGHGQDIARVNPCTMRILPGASALQLYSGVDSASQDGSIRNERFEIPLANGIVYAFGEIELSPDGKRYDVRAEWIRFTELPPEIELVGRVEMINFERDIANDNLRQWVQENTHEIYRFEPEVADFDAAPETEAQLAGV